MYSHTHKYGTAYNVWLRNPDGSKGARIYDGNYSYEQGFDVGYYRNGPHVTFRTWADDSLFQIDPRLGIIAEGTFINTAGPDPVTWGFSSADEMMAVGFYFIYGDDLPTAITNQSNDEQTLTVFPNPANDEFVISYELSEAATVHVDLFDMLGKKVGNLLDNAPQTKGKYTHSFNTADYKLTSGIYLLSFNIGGKTATQKLIIE